MSKGVSEWVGKWKVSRTEEEEAGISTRCKKVERVGVDGSGEGKVG